MSMPNSHAHSSIGRIGTLSCKISQSEDDNEKVNRWTDDTRRRRVIWMLYLPSIIACTCVSRWWCHMITWFHVHFKSINYTCTNAGGGNTRIKTFLNALKNIIS